MRGREAGATIASHGWEVGRPAPRSPLPAPPSNSMPQICLTPAGSPGSLSPTTSEASVRTLHPFAVGPGAVRVSGVSMVGRRGREWTTADSGEPGAAFFV
jgi:hypothetical protein